MLAARTQISSGRRADSPRRQRSRWSAALRRLIPVASLSSILLLTTACQAPPAASGPTDMVLRIPDREAYLDASLSILRQCDLPPERVDRERGLIVTHRTTSGQWFEPWRVDSQGPYQVLESSLHTIGRVVTVSMQPLAEGPADCRRITVRVDKSRYSAPERQITTASGALAIYSETIPTTEGLRRARTPGAHWVPLGRDALLEAYLLAKLAYATPDVELVD